MKECDICNGTGEYPIHNRFAFHVYSIVCPECHGDGEADDEPEADDHLPPASTAATIKTMDDLRRHMEVERFRSKATPSP
jgi:hypothetical protein